MAYEIGNHQRATHARCRRGDCQQRFGFARDTGALTFYAEGELHTSRTAFAMVEHILDECEHARFEEDEADELRQALELLRPFSNEPYHYPWQTPTKRKAHNDANRRAAVAFVNKVNKLAGAPPEVLALSEDREKRAWNRKIVDKRVEEDKQAEKAEGRRKEEEVHAATVAVDASKLSPRTSMRDTASGQAPFGKFINESASSRKNVFHSEASRKKTPRKTSQTPSIAGVFALSPASTRTPFACPPMPTPPPSTLTRKPTYNLYKPPSRQTRRQQSSFDQPVHKPALPQKRKDRDQESSDAHTARNLDNELDL